MVFQVAALKGFDGLGVWPFDVGVVQPGCVGAKEAVGEVSASGDAPGSGVVAFESVVDDGDLVVQVAVADGECGASQVAEEVVAYKGLVAGVAEVDADVVGVFQVVVGDGEGGFFGVAVGEDDGDFVDTDAVGWERGLDESGVVFADIDELVGVDGDVVVGEVVVAGVAAEAEGVVVGVAEEVAADGDLFDTWVDGDYGVWSVGIDIDEAEAVEGDTVGGDAEEGGAADACGGGGVGLAQSAPVVSVCRGPLMNAGLAARTVSPGWLKVKVVMGSPPALAEGSM